MKVYTCVVGDLFHWGHVEFLKKAKAQGDYLLVGICSDEECIYYKRKPIMNVNERAAVVAACKYVDEVILNPPSIVKQAFMDEYKIDLLVHGGETTEELLLYFYGDAIRAGKYKSLGYTNGISTTEIIDRITNRTPEELQRKYFLKDGV